MAHHARSRCSVALWTIAGLSAVPAVAQPTTLISVEPDGTGANNHCSSHAISRDGRYVAFDSAANMSGGQQTGLRDIYLRDRQLGTTVRVSLSWNGQSGTFNSIIPTLSSDARYVCFQSDHPSLVQGDTNGLMDVFLYDRVNGQTELISVSSSGQQGNGFSFGAQTSSGARWIVFNSFASNFVSGDSSNTRDVFVRDRVLGTTTLVSATPAGLPGNAASRTGSISDDGNWVAFYSEASNLIAGDFNNSADVFVREMATGTTLRISQGLSGAEANSHSYDPFITADGARIVFLSEASNLVAGDSNVFTDAFVYDAASESITRVSVSSSGQQANDAISGVSISPDGSRVAFTSPATNLVTESDTNSGYDVFVHDLTTSETVRVSVATDGTQGNSHNGEQDGTSLSQGGTTVIFNSSSTNLSPADSTAFRDIYARELPIGGCTPPEITTQPSGQSVCAGSPFVLSATASGSPAPAFQWRRNGAPIPGATQSTYSVASAIPQDAGSYDLVATNPCGAATSDSVVVTVGTMVTSQPQNQTGCIGGSVAFSVQAAGPAPVSYQWRRNGSNIEGATSSTLMLQTLASGDAGTYDVVVTSPCGSVASAPAALTVIAAVAITQQPSNQTICAGSSLTLTVSASGGAPLHYQWRQNGQNVGVDSPTYFVQTAFENVAGTYDVIVSNVCSSATSAAATVIVSASPMFAQQPDDAALCEGEPLTLSVAVQSAAPLTYQWRKNNVDIPGATGTELLFASLTPEDTGAYQCIATNVCGPVGSQSADVLVKTPPVITEQPSSQSPCQGETVVLSVSATGNVGDPPLTFQWRHDETDIPGATASSHELSNITLGDAGTYDVAITNSCGTTTSDAAIIAVSPDVTPSITQHPANQTGCLGESATFNVGAIGTTLSYQWQKFQSDPNGMGQFVDVPGATGAAHTISPIVAASAGSYRVRVSNACRVIFSSSASLLIDNGSLTIAQHPQDTIACDGGVASLSVSPAGTEPFTYQWRKNGVAVPGGTTNPLVFDPVSPADAGSYDVVVQTTCGGMATSNAANLNVVANDPPAITQQPADTVACEGADATLTVVATGSPPLLYQWRKNGLPLPGETGASLAIVGVIPADEGFYDVLVSNPCGQAQSATAELLVDNLPLITRQPKARIVAEGEGVTLFVEADAPLPLTYQWRRNGAVIAGETQSEFTLIEVLAGDAGDYDVLVSNTCGTITSSTANLSRILTPNTTRASLTTDDVQGSQDSRRPSLSADGRLVAFESDADSFLHGPGDNFTHVFVRDRRSARQMQIDAAPGDGSADADTHAGMMSPDERWIVFESDATNLVAGDTNAARDVFLLDTFNNSVIRISYGPGGAPANGGSRAAVVASTASRVAFVSDASNLVSGDTNAAADVFVYERATGAITRISVDSAGAQANGASDGPAISADGRFIAFWSAATNLLPGDTNTAADIFVHDVQTGETTRVSVDSNGVQGNSASRHPSISADGTHVGFESDASNLVSGDTNNQSDVFVHVLADGTTTRASRGPAGAEPDAGSWGITLSGTGRHVAYLSLATNLVSGDTNGFADAYLLDRDSDNDGSFDEGDEAPVRASFADGSGFQPNAPISRAQLAQNGAWVIYESVASNLVNSDANGVSDIFLSQPSLTSTQRISVSDNELEAVGASRRALISGNLQYVVFVSDARNLVAGDTNHATDLYTRNIQLNQTTLHTRGWRANHHGLDPRISGDGRYVVFETLADLYPQNGPYSEIILRDLETHAFEVISANAAGEAANDNSNDAFISADGRYVAFGSSATNLIPGASGRVFLKDRQTGALERLDVNSSGQPSNASTAPIGMSADARFIVLSSSADNLVAGDTNLKNDIFVRDRQSQTTVRASLSNTGEQPNRDCYEADVSDDGRYVAFSTDATNMSAADTNGQFDVYLRDLQAGTTALVTVALSGVAGNQGGGAPVLSADGRYVAFHSNATDLIAFDASPYVDIYVRDMQMSQTRLVNINSSGQQGAGGDSSFPAVSADARYFAFASRAANLVSDDTNGRQDIFVHDSGGCLEPAIADQPDDLTVFIGQPATFTVGATGTPPLSYQWRREGVDIAGAMQPSYTIAAPTLDDAGSFDVVVTNGCGSAISAAAALDVTPCAPTTEVASVSAPSAQAIATSAHPSLSGDGRYVAFHSASDNLVPGDVFGFTDVFVRDRLNSSTTQISVPVSGPFSNAGSHYPAISPDGRFVVFESQASNLITGDTNNSNDVFLRDRDPDGNGVLDEATALTARISVRSGGAQSQGSGSDFGPALTPDGRFVAFESGASDIVPGLPNGVKRIYVHDRQTVTTQLVTLLTNGQPSQHDSWHPSISADGRYVAFRSRSNDLVVGDTNVHDDIFVFDRQTNVTTLVSLTSGGGAANEMSWWPRISADGRYVSFVSRASNLVPNDTNSVEDVFVRDRIAATTTRVSVGPSGAQANGLSRETAISADGRFVAFYSDASNLVAADSNGARDAFLHDRTLGTTLCVSVFSNSVQGNGATGSGQGNVDRGIALTGDGAQVATFSGASNLVMDDTNGAIDVFMHDVEAAASSRASLSGGGVAGSSASMRCAVSADGAFVAFLSGAANLVAGDTNSIDDVFLRDRLTGETIRVSRSAAGVQVPPGHANGSPAISADGRFVGFRSSFDGLVPGDSNGRTDIVAYDRLSGELSLISLATSGAQGNFESGDRSAARIAFSASGRFVVFTSDASNFVAGDQSGTEDVFYRDRDPDDDGLYDEPGSTTVCVSIAFATGLPTGTFSSSPSISADGRYVAFFSPSANLVSGDTNNVNDVFLRDMQTGTTTRISVGAGGLQSNGASDQPMISADGQKVAFVSSASNLISGDTNNTIDVFVYDRPTGTTVRANLSATGAQVGSGAEFPSISGDGRYAAFTGFSSAYVPNDTNDRADVFVRDLIQNTTTRVSVSSGGIQGNQDSLRPAISENGATIAFVSNASNLVSTPLPGGPQIYLHARGDCLPAGLMNPPQDQTAELGASARLTVTASGNPPPDFQWRKNGVDIPNAVRPTLTFEFVRASDAGQYTVVVSNELGETESAPAELVVLTPCPGDINGDRVVSLSDLATLLGHFGMANGATLEDGDLNGDGDVDLADLAELLSRFGTICP